MKNYVLSFFGFILFFLSCQKNISSHEKNQKIKEVEAFITAYYSVMSDREWTVYRDFFSERAVLTTIWQESTAAAPQLFATTISEFIAQTASGPDSQPIFSEKPIKIEVEIKENLASVWVKYEAKFGRKNNLIEWRGYDLFSLLKMEDKWKITSLTYIETSD